MGLLDSMLSDGRKWIRVGDAYEVTKKPRSLDWSSVEDVPFAAMEAIPQGGYYAPTFTMKPATSINSGTYFERGDILVAKITPSFENGKQALVLDLPTPFGYATTEVIPLHPRDASHDRRFLFFYLLHPDVRHYIAERMEGSTARQRVPDDVLLGLPLPNIAPDDQPVVADALELIQHAVHTQVRSEATARDLKRAAMREIFTRGLRGEPQKETQIGLMPESWSVVVLGDYLTRAQYGLSLRGQPAGQYPILRMNCQEDGHVSFRSLQFVDLDAKTFLAFRLDDGDLLFNRTNSYDLVGRMAIFRSQRDAVFASYLIRLTLDREAFVPAFVNYYFNQTAIQANLRARASRGVSQANISATAIKSIALPKPTLDEQREIISVLDAIDRKIDAHRRKRALLEDLFKSLLHKLMTGEVRISDLDLSALRSDDTAAAVTS